MRRLLLTLSIVTLTASSAIAQQRSNGIRAISSPVTAEAAVISLGKSMVIDLEEDATDAFVGNP